jgi:hypothetical protein
MGHTDDELEAMRGQLASASKKFDGERDRSYRQFQRIAEQLEQRSEMKEEALVSSVGALVCSIIIVTLRSIIANREALQLLLLYCCKLFYSILSYPTMRYLTLYHHSYTTTTKHHHNASHHITNTNTGAGRYEHLPSLVSRH